jgi:hypothetical protein
VSNSLGATTSVSIATLQLDSPSDAIPAVSELIGGVVHDAVLAGDASTLGRLAAAAAGVLNTHSSADVVSMRASLLQSVAAVALPPSTTLVVEQQLQLLSVLTMMPNQLNQAAVDAGSSLLVTLATAPVFVSPSAAQTALSVAGRLLAAPSSSATSGAQLMAAVHGVTRAQLRSMVCGQQPIITSVPGLATTAAKLMVGQAAEILVGQVRFALPASIISSRAVGVCYGAEAVEIDGFLNPYSYSSATYVVCLGVFSV